MQLNFYNSQLDRTIGFWSNALVGYKEEDLLIQPHGNQWSIGQLFMHLIEETNWFLDQVEICMDSNKNSKEKMAEKAKKMFQLNEFPDERIKGMATLDNVPQPRNKTELTGDFLTLGNRASEIGERLLKSNSRSKTQHPGLGFFSAAEWFQYAEMHIRHHTKQKARIDSYLKSII